MDALMNVGGAIANTSNDITGGIAVGSSLVTLISHYAISKGKEIYQNHRSVTCQHPTNYKIAGVALMTFGLLAGIASSVASGFFSAVVLSSLGSSFGPVGTILGIGAGALIGIASLVSIIFHFIISVKKMNDCPYIEPDEFIYSYTIMEFNRSSNEDEECCRYIKYTNKIEDDKFVTSVLGIGRGGAEFELAGYVSDERFRVENGLVYIKQDNHWDIEATITANPKKTRPFTF